MINYNTGNPQQIMNLAIAEPLPPCCVFSYLMAQLSVIVIPASIPAGRAPEASQAAATTLAYVFCL
jgi:hypothetical protein